MAHFTLTKTLTAGTDAFLSPPTKAPADCWVYGSAAFTFYPNGITGGGISIPATTWTPVGMIADLSATRMIGTLSSTATLWGDFA